mmetsp:Transcript_2286/g.5212  ORF Transcript_2286/g.5212 Transcript_2286/m.5212 type:complete len:153 (-) Transcript_2286:71-529(-)
MFLQRDCSYYEDKSLLQNPNLKVHYGDTMFQPCAAPATNGIPRSSFADTAVLLKLLQAQIGCGATSVQDILREFKQGIPMKTASEAESSLRSQSKGGKKSPIGMHASSITVTSSALSQDAVRMQLYALLAGVAAFICLFLRRIKFKSKPRRR